MEAVLALADGRTFKITDPNDSNWSGSKVCQTIELSNSHKMELRESIMTQDISELKLET